MRAHGEALGAHIVMCLHDELLVHTPVAQRQEVARIIDDGLQEAVRRWAPDDSVRFLAETTVIRRWSEGKGGPQ